MSDIYLSLTETPSVVTLSQPVVASVMVNTVTVANVVSVNVVTMPAINVTAAGGLTNAELRASAVSVAVTTMPALSISSVTISNFPASQTINGAVTVGSVPPIQWSNANAGNAPTTVNQNAPLPVQLYVGAVPTSVTLGATITNSVTIGSLPAISGTVTANQPSEKTSSSIYSVGSDKVSIVGGVWWDQSNYIATPIRVGEEGEVFIGSLPPISGTVTVGNSVTIGSLPTLAPQLPRVTFIDGSGSVTTANSAITVFASSTTRSYLLVQVTTGSAFVNVGATATTVNGINLTAGQGYAWETTIPQGLVSLISTTTSSRWVAKEA